MFPIPTSSIRWMSNVTSTEWCVLQRINFSEVNTSKFRVLNRLANRLLRKFTEQSPSWEADTFSASQEIALILFQPNVKCRVHSSQPASCWQQPASRLFTAASQPPVHSSQSAACSQQPVSRLFTAASQPPVPLLRQINPVHALQPYFFKFRLYIILPNKKAVPLQTWSGPEGSRKLRFSDCMTTAQDGGKFVSLTHRPPLPPGNTPGTHFC